MRYKLLTEKRKIAVIRKIKTLLHASRDGMRNRFEPAKGKENNNIDPSQIDFYIGEPYYCEAFGMLHALKVLGYGSLELGTSVPICFRNNEKGIPLNALFENLKEQVAIEEGFCWRKSEEHTNRCDWCYLKYGHDGLRTKWYSWNTEHFLTDNSSLMQKIGLAQNKKGKMDEKAPTRKIIEPFLKAYPNGYSVGLIDYAPTASKIRYLQLMADAQMVSTSYALEQMQSLSRG